MRRLVALVVTALGIGLLAPAGTAQAVEYGPHVKVAKVIKDAGRIGVMDAGDIVRFRFSSPVKITDITSFYIGMKGANGVYERLENDVEGAGFISPVLTENDTLLTISINLSPVYGSPTMTYPVTLTPERTTVWNGSAYEDVDKIWWNICGRTECRPINNARGDLLIDKG